jgi:hypothetical protein
MSNASTTGTSITDVDQQHLNNKTTTTHTVCDYEAITSIIDENTIEHSNQLYKILRSHRAKYNSLPNNLKVEAMGVINKLKLDRKIPIKQKPVHFINPQGHECSICTAAYDQNERIVECSSCKQQLHFKCLIGWCYECIRDGQSSTCPYCRAAWKDNGKLTMVK